MIVHLVDGTYELFRHFFGARRGNKGVDLPHAAVLGVLNTILQMIEGGGDHIGVATDHVIESFRNDLWPGYKTGAGIDRVLWSQFHPLEDALGLMGVATWPMVELEADDGLASAAAIASRDPAVLKVCIWTSDKDLTQCVVDDRVVQVDRKSGFIRNAAAVREKFGVAPHLIPDYLALVGDKADGFPGIPGFGPRSAATVLNRHGHIVDMPAADDPGVPDSGRSLLKRIHDTHELALLFLELATLRTDAPLFDTAADIRWRGPQPGFDALMLKMDGQRVLERAHRAAEHAAEHKDGTGFAQSARKQQKGGGE
jgi:5'-3' exonuclease